MFGLDGRVVRIVWTLAFCYLLYLLRATILLVVLAVIAAYLLLPTVEFIYGKFTHHRHRGWALALVYLLIFADPGHHAAGCCRSPASTNVFASLGLADPKLPSTILSSS